VVLGRLPITGKSDGYVFSLNGEKPIAGLSRLKAPATSSNDVRPDIVERCLGHEITGVAGVYNRSSYERDKRKAFEILAAAIERILNPQPNVVPMRAAE
jgi:hypothetical protein